MREPLRSRLRNTPAVWGFPTLENVPYPVDRTATNPPVSEPLYLGRFDLAKMKSAR
jgi:hypothetical protein